MDRLWIDRVDFRSAVIDQVLVAVEESSMASRIQNRLDDQEFDAVDRARIARLFDDSLGALTSTFEREAAGAWWVPGRIEVFGKHTDYAGGRSLIATVPRGFAFVGAPRRDGIVRVVDAATGERREYAPGDPSTPSRGDWGHYIAVVLARFARNFPPTSIGADLAFVSDLPRAAGVSSSSALTVGAAMALARLNRLDLHPAWRANLDSPIALASYLSCVENGLTFGSLEGDAGVGTFSGSEDHTAMLCCRPGVLSVYAFVPVRHVEDAPMPDDWAFVIAASGVLSEKTGAAQALYNRAALGASALLEIWNAANPPQPSLAAALQAGEDAESRLRLLVERTPRPGWSSADLQRRLTHFINEDGRVPMAARAFRQRDADALRALAADSQADADALLGNQIDETNALATLAASHGGWAACAFGAGFGGSVWALVPGEQAAALGDRWMSAYRARFPAHESARWFVARPGPPFIEMLRDP